MQKEQSLSLLYTFDRQIIESSGKGAGFVVVGVDEAGRGPLAGPVVAGAVILDQKNPIKGVDDSKKLSGEIRVQLYDVIIEKALAWGTGSASHIEIDKVNILQATFLAMERALDAIQTKWDLAIIDGNRGHPRIPVENQRTIVDGDALSASIAAASIVAKVTRDRIMEKYHEEYPEYDFISNKGYATETHRSRIIEHGLCKIHRRTFCSELLAAQMELPL